jgi:anti-sigma-K factor RskA
MNTDHSLPGDEPPEDRVLAGEFVLGVLDAGSRRAFAARLERDAALAREVAAWSARMAPLLAEIEPVAPPPGLWHRIRTRVGLDGEGTRALPWWDRLGFWRGLSGAALATMVATLALWLSPRAPPPALPHPLASTATIVRGDGTAAFLAAIDEDACTMMVMPLPGLAMPAGRVPEVWLIGGDGVPRSLGIANVRNTRAMLVPAALREGVLSRQALAVSDEPRGGSPTGRPTGTVIASGEIVRL